MVEFFLTFFILVMVLLAMSVGILRGRAPIKGSCGGLNNLGIDSACEICGGDVTKCENSADTGTASVSNSPPGSTQ